MPGFDREIAKLAQRVLINPRSIDYHTGVLATKVTPGATRAIMPASPERSSCGLPARLIWWCEEMLVSRSPVALVAESGLARGHRCSGVKPVIVELTDFKTKQVVDHLEVDAVLVATGRAPYTQVQRPLPLSHHAFH